MIKEPAGQTIKPRCAEYGGSGCGCEGDGVAELLEVADVGLFLAVGVRSGVVEPGPEVVEAGVGVSEQVPHDGQDGASDRDDRFLLPAASRDPPVAFTEEGVGAAGGDRGFAQHAGEVGVAVPG